MACFGLGCILGINNLWNMDQAQKEELPLDWWHFMIIGSFLYSMFYTVAEKIVTVEGLPFQYFVLS
ncbi:hypothetical protein GCM10007423_01220 [Dyadobacter endophyticus]|uniref:EamA-like transporter family protein n=1 Tax=Dyadobacter endophyticus TaxID=1749036 RepID=A0ABQ1YC56_9BACT|nr:hypothetical protein GCM10007423_01220 [Dyadobacter endophyticus]